MKTKVTVRIGLLTILLPGAFSYGEDPASSKIGPLYVIEVMPSALNVEIDSTHQFSAVGRDADMIVIEDLTFTWTSRYPEVGMVDQNGLFTAITSGTTFLTAKSGTVESLPADVSVIEATTGTVTDIDGNVYQTVKIGDQWWLAENLKVTHYRNGEAIPNVTDANEWYNLTTGAYCEYDNNSANVETYGLLYNWDAVSDIRNIAPEGWHVPTDEEWKQLEMYLGMSQAEADDTGWRGTDQGSQLAGNAGLWSDGALENNAAFGSSGLAALPGGYRDGNGDFDNVGNFAGFWSAAGSSSASAWSRLLSFGNGYVYRLGDDERGGFSVRLLRDL